MTRKRLNKISLLKKQIKKEIENRVVYNTKIKNGRAVKKMKKSFFFSSFKEKRKRINNAVKDYVVWFIGESRYNRLRHWAVPCRKDSEIVFIQNLNKEFFRNLNNNKHIFFLILFSFSFVSVFFFV